MNFNHSFSIDSQPETKDVKIYYISGKNYFHTTNKAVEILKNLDIENFDIISYSNKHDFWQGLSEDKKACVYLDFNDNEVPLSEFFYITSQEKLFNYDYDLKWIQNNYEHVIIISEKPLDNIYLKINDPILSQKFHCLLERIENIKIK